MRELLGLTEGPGENGETVRRFGWRALAMLALGVTLAVLLQVVLTTVFQGRVSRQLLANQERMLESQERTIRAIRHLDRNLVQWAKVINELDAAARVLHEKQHEAEAETGRLQKRQAELEQNMAIVRKALSEYARALRGGRRRR